MSKPDYETYRKMMEAQQAEGEGFEEQINPPETSDEQCFTAAEIAAYLNVGVEEFYSRAGHGDLLPVQIEGQYVYRFKDVMRLLINLGVIEGDSQW